MFNFIYSRNAKLFEPLLCHFELNCPPADLSFVHLPLKTAKYGRIKLGARQQYVSLLQGSGARCSLPGQLVFIVMCYVEAEGYKAWLSHLGLSPAGSRGPASS